jgi:hypothetical protein
MGDDTASIGACTNAGELRSEPADMPNLVQCFLIEKLGM